VALGWANRITLARAVLTLVIWGLVTVAGSSDAPALWWTAFVLFVVAAASDALDGLLARRLQQVSVFGRIADPLVDKMLTIGTLTVLLGVPVLHPWLPGWAVALMLTREILITTVRAAAEGRGINFQAVSWGKHKMVLQCFAVGALMLCPLDVGLARDEIGALAWLPGAAGTWNLAHALVWLATLLTVASGVVYVARAVRMFRDAR
jgi:CDP-diacylglycerol--glycerol-3-phosphate 3-phosphatidyltransferase